MLNALAKSAPKLVEDLVPRLLPMSTVVRVLQGLLAERVPVRNMRAIIETLAEHAPRTQDPAQLQAQVRVALGRQIVQEIAGLREELPVITLENDLEQLLQGSLARPAPPAPASSPASPSACNATSPMPRAARKYWVNPRCCWCRRRCARRWRASCARACPDCRCWPGTKFPITVECGS